MCGKSRYLISSILALAFVLMPVSNAAQWNIDFQGDEHHNNTYGQTDPADYSPLGVYWNMFEVAALSAPWPGPTNYTSNPSMDLADEAGSFGLGKPFLVKFSIMGDAYGWAGEAGAAPLTGDYLIILNGYGVTNDPTKWEITGLAPNTPCCLTYYHRYNVSGRGINFVADGIATTVVGTAGLDVASAWVTTDGLGKITGTADSNGYSEGNWSGLTITLAAARGTIASNPQPANGATDMPTDVILSWDPGHGALMHDVYFGTDEAAVAAGDQSTFKGILMVASYDPGELEPFTTYYWKVDEFTPTGTVPGSVWSFTSMAQPVADYGDAPDPGFPSFFSSGGPCHLDVSQEWIGGPSSVTSIEPESIQPNGDADDKNAWWWYPPFEDSGFFITLVSYDTTKSNPDDPRYLNVLVDLDESGTWDPNDEWPVRNLTIPFEDLPQDVGTMYVVARLPESIDPCDLLPDKWTRVTLSDREVPHGYGAWGVFGRGETEDFTNTPDPPPEKIEVPFIDSPKVHSNSGMPWYPWLVWPDVKCGCGFIGKWLPSCCGAAYCAPDRGWPCRWRIWIPKLDPDRWYNARILIRKDGIVLFYVDGVLVYMSSHRITPAYDGQAAVEIGNRKSLYDNVLVAEPGLHVNKDPVFFKEDFSGDLSEWNLWHHPVTPYNIEKIDSDGNPPPCSLLDDFGENGTYAVSKKTFSYLGKSIEFSADIRQGNPDFADQRFACLHVSKRNVYIPGDDYFARIKVTGSSDPNKPNTVYCELLYEDPTSGEEKWEKSEPIPIPYQEVKQVSVQFLQDPAAALVCPCRKLCTDLGHCFLARRLAAAPPPNHGDVIADLNGGWVDLLDKWGNPKFGLHFGTNIVDGYLAFEPTNAEICPKAYDRVKLKVRTIYDPGGDFICRYDYPKSFPVASPGLEAAIYVSPPHGATDVEFTPTLRWSPGVGAIQHDVYFGTDQDTVANADTTTSAIYRGRQPFDANTYTPWEAPLKWGQTYYWRIDEGVPQMDESVKIYKGYISKFTVTDHLVVDDFESYSDQWPGRIFETWIDGRGYFIPPMTYDLGNGTGSSADINSVIVYGGAQSMKLGYDNTGTGTNIFADPITAYYSETERTFDTPQDWTRNGVEALTLWFYGDPNNNTEQIYVAVEDNMGMSKLVNHPNPNAVLSDMWEEWNIDLREFSDAGVDLTNVRKLYIGVGDRAAPELGGTGTLYFDDIRLYPPRCVPEFGPIGDLTDDCVVDYLDLNTMGEE